MFSAPQVIAALVTAAICLIISLVAWSRRYRSDEALPVALLMLALAWWVAFNGIGLTSPNLAADILYSKLEYFGIVSVAPLLLICALRHVGLKHWLTRRRLLLLAVIPVVILVLAWTNDYHGLIWSSYEVYSLGRVTATTIVHGPAFWVQIVFVYLVYALTTVLFIRHSLISVHVYRRQAIVITVALLLPWISNILYITGFNPVPGLDPTSFSFAITGILIAYALLRLEFLDIVPLARTALIQHMRDGVIMLDNTDRIADINPAATEMLGIKVPKVINRSAASVLPPAVSNFIGDETAGHLEITRGRNDNLRHYEVRNTRLTDSQGETVGRLLVIHDITERRRSEEERLRSGKAEALNVLASAIAHDFNNLLTGIIGFLALAQRESGDNETLQGYLKEIENVTDSMKGLTQQLMNFSRSTAVESKLSDIAALLRQMTRFSLVGSEIENVFDFPEDLWQARVDTIQISQAFSNLVINADQAMPNGGKLTVRARNVHVSANRVDALPAGHYLKLDFTDTGVGIPEENLPRIFDPYFTTKPNGNGLGLAGVYAIVKKHRGHVSITSAPGAGTTVTVLLPAEAHPDATA